MRKKLEVAIVLTATTILITCIVITAYLLMFVAVEGAGRRGLLQRNITNTTDYLTCYITNTTTIESLRDCFRG
jgi:hypothetical protein